MAETQQSRSLLAVCAALILAWGLLSFGAVYPWGFGPLLAAALLLGGWLAVASRSAADAKRALFAASLLFAPMLLQVIPVPHVFVERVSPAASDVVRQYSVEYAGDRAAALHPLSVDPALTLRTAFFLAVGTVWVFGLSRGFRRQLSLITLVCSVLGLGALTAIFAIVQAATFNGKIYWLWESPFRFSANYFGPFVNRNHFAGWMILATSVGAGYLCDRLERAAAGLKPDWRNRILWLSTPDASGLILTGAALGVMWLSLVWSMSRSGIAGALVGTAVVAATRARIGGWKAILAVLPLALAAGGAIAWRGATILADWYGHTSTLEWRFALWHDSFPMLQHFWLSGSGLNTYGVLTLFYAVSDPTVHAQQAHSDYLQLAIEGGLLVTVPWLIAATILVTRIARRLAQPQDNATWWIRLGAVAGLCGLAVQELTEFSLQIPGVALLFATLIAIAIHEPSAAAVNDGRQRTRAPAGLVALRPT